MNLHVTIPYRLSVMITREENLLLQITSQLQVGTKPNNTTIHNMFWQAENWYLRLLLENHYSLKQYEMRVCGQYFHFQSRISQKWIYFKLIQSTTLVEHKSLNIKHVTNQGINFNLFYLGAIFFLFFPVILFRNGKYIKFSTLIT